MFDKTKPHSYKVEGTTYSIPEQWKEILGVEVLSYSKSLRDRLTELKISPRNFKDCMMYLSEEFRQWYNTSKESSLNLRASKESRIAQMKKTNIARYGNVCPLKNTKIDLKRKESFTLTLGVDNPFKSREIQSDIYDTRYPDTKYRKCDEQELIRFLKEEHGILVDSLPYRTRPFVDITAKCATCGRTFTTQFLTNGNILHCPFCNKSSTILERHLAEFIENLGFNVLPHFRPKNFKGKEIDIFLPDLNIGFEINGAYTHNSGFDPFGATPKPRLYHSRKTQEAQNIGIKLYHLWEHWPVEITKSIIKAKLRAFDSTIYARNTTVSFSKQTRELEEFFVKSHVLSSTNFSFSVNLRLEDEIVQAVQFKIISPNTIELVRNVSRINTQILGGIDKIFKYAILFIKKNYPKVSNIITFAIRDLTPFKQEAVYFRLGFDCVGDSGPSLSYYVYKPVKSINGRIIIQDGIYKREKFMKNRIPSMFKVALDQNGNKFEFHNEETEQQNLMRLGIYPVFNSGCWKYIYKLK